MFGKVPGQRMTKRPAGTPAEKRETILGDTPETGVVTSFDVTSKAESPTKPIANYDLRPKASAPTPTPVKLFNSIIELGRRLKLLPDDASVVLDSDEDALPSEDASRTHDRDLERKALHDAAVAI